ncbi:hypothetical protein [Fodinibius halophilus]|uniref:Uncharacterized protein n=1 Tax=Fodinibius halophilus TaxID=1736908 RepID=A0A6M1T6R8_9BACT|nr:hypothetical protein [Fodinibius halophilus]NGP89857.1 hypothetical protein [Fodinibius halophilus]
MKKATRSLKIKIEDADYLKEEWESIARWESEGGGSEVPNTPISYINAPLKQGEVFEVTGGKIIFEDDGPYYCVEVKLLALH